MTILDLSPESGMSTAMFQGVISSGTEYIKRNIELEQEEEVLGAWGMPFLECPELGIVLELCLLL